MKTKIATVILSAIFFMSSYAGAYIIDYNDVTDTGTQFTSSYSGAIIETFDNTDLLWSWSGDYTILYGSTGENAAPAYSTTEKNTSKYISVPNPKSNGTARAVLGADYNYFGLWWGSVDDYNTIDFYKDDVLVETIGGLDITNPANGNQSAPSTNLYVNFYDLTTFDEFRLTSTSFAFEVDNIAVGASPVPEPGTLLLLGSGLAGLALYRRRMNKA